MTHCDDIIDDPSAPAALREFLAFHRQPAISKRGDGPTLFATLVRVWHRPDSKDVPAGARVRVVMASRFGDVGITTNLEAVRGYEARILLDYLTDFGEKP